MNLALTRSISGTPVLDFRAILTLEADDTREGYKLCLGDFIHVDLRNIETAYLEADAAGLRAGVLVQMNYRPPNRVSG